MATSNAVGQVGLRGTAGLLLAVSLAACASEDPASPAKSPQTTGGDPGACTQVDAPMLDIPTAGDTEPQMRIPQPPGWERSTELDNAGGIVRFTLANPALVADEPPQNIVVVDLLTGPPDVEAQTAFDQMRAGLVNDLGWRDFKTTAGTVCGLPAETHTRASTDVGVGTMNIPPRRRTTTLSVVTKADDYTYMAAVTAATMPDDPKYARDAETILAGFQVLPPATA